MKGLGLRTHEVGFAESVQQTARKINRSGIVIKVRASDFTQPLGRMSAKANEFTKSLEASNARVIAFGASAAIIGGVTTSFAQLVIQATKVEKILTDINVVLGTTSQNLAKFGDGLFKVARNTSQSLETAAEAALEFSRQGLSMEETLKRTNDALILTRLTSLKAADSVKGLTAAVNGFADAGLTTTNIINKLAAVDVKFAVSTDDLINALARAGAVAQDAGVSFDQLMGAVTAAQQITARGGAVIGNSFKTIFTRVQRSSTIKRLEELGIAVRNVRGETLPAMSVLKNLADTYEGLEGATKAAVAEQVGGVFQINILKAAIKDLNKETSIYSKATEASATATNQAQMKNAQLQKTLSSIAAQTLTTVRELTANLGELTIAPALKDFLESANKLLGGLSDLFGDKEGETIGGEFAKGFARALGSVLTGPGVMITVLVFAKLFAQAFKFAKDSIKDLLQIASIKDKERMIQESIVDAMIKNVDLSKQLIAYDKDQVKQEQVVLALLKEQTAHLEQQRAIAKAIAPALRKQGVQPNLVVDNSSKNKSEGFVPNYNNQPTALEKLKERQGAAKGGYTAGAISTMNVSGLGRVVYNKAETVKKFDGMRQPAIMPPEKSKAGRKYKDKFSGAHGFDPYQGSKNNSTYSVGFVPNFARKVGSTLEMDPAKLVFVGGGGSNKQERAQIAAALKDPKQLMYFTAALDQIAGYDKNGKLKTGARVMNPLSVLQHELGIHHIKRGFSMRKKPRLRGNQKDPADAMEEKVAGVERQNQKHASLSPKLRATRTGYRDKKTGQKKGIQNYPVDVVSYGASWPTIEVKSGEFHPHNIISKSLRMSSDRELGDFIRKNTSRSDIADALDQANFNSAASAAKSLDLFDPVSAKKVADRNFDINNLDDRKFIDEWGLSKGLVPNFVSQNAREAIMRLRKQGATKGERAAADAALGRTGKKTFNIKKKDGTRASMYESMYIDSYIKGAGGKSDLEYLLGKGFDKSVLTSARKAFKSDPKTIINSSKGFVPNFNKPQNMFSRAAGGVVNFVKQLPDEWNEFRDFIGGDNLITEGRDIAAEEIKNIPWIKRSLEKAGAIKRAFKANQNYKNLRADLSEYKNMLSDNLLVDGADEASQYFKWEIKNLKDKISSLMKNLMGRKGKSEGFVPNFAKLYQVFRGGQSHFSHLASASVGYPDSPDDLFLKSLQHVDGLIEQGYSNGGSDGSIGFKEFNVPDQNLKQMLSGVYKGSKLSQLRNFAKGNIKSARGAGLLQGSYLKSYNRFLKGGNSEKENESNLVGGAKNPFPLARNYPNGGIVIPSSEQPFKSPEAHAIRSIFGFTSGPQRMATSEYVGSNKGMIQDLSKNMAKNPDRAIMAGRRGGFQGLKSHLSRGGRSEGLIPNYVLYMPSHDNYNQRSDWGERRRKKSKTATIPAQAPTPSRPPREPSEYPANYKMPDINRFNAKNPFPIYRYLTTFGENSQSIDSEMKRRQQGGGFDGLVSHTNVEALRKQYREVAGEHYRVGHNAGIFNRFILDQSDVGLIGSISGDKFISNKALLDHHKSFFGKDDRLYGKYKRYTTAQGPSGPDQKLSGGLIPNFMEEVDRKRREKEIRDSHQDGSMNRKYFGGLIPNFAFQNTPIRLNGGFGPRGRQIMESKTGSYMNYINSGHNVRDIDFLQSNKKGDAYKMFKREAGGRFMKGGGVYTSGSLKQQRSFKQGSSSNFEDLLYAFPQLRYRMQKGITTSGRLINEGLMSQHKFNTISDLKSYANSVNRKDFQSALGAQALGNRILVTDLSTGRDGSKNRKYFGGMIPNFMEEVDRKRREKEIRDSHQDGSMNRKYFGGLIPNFADQLEHKQREKDIRDSHQDGSMNRKYSQGLVPNFNVGYAISDQSASKWYNAGKFGAKSQAKIFPTLSAAQNTANIIQSNRKMKVRIFYISDGGGIREVIGAFSDTVYRPGRSDGMVPDMSQDPKGKGRDGKIKEKHQDGSDNQKYFKGLIPNFLAEQLEHKQREKDIMESHQDGSMNRKYFRGLIPNFANDIENKQREKEIFESHQDGSKNRKYSSGLVPNFIRSGATSREFAKLSVALAKWSAKNHPEPRLKLIGPDKLFSIPRRNADEANKNIQNIRQFISSAEYRALEAPELKKKITRFYARTIARSSLDNPDRSFTKGDPTFEGRIAASNGLIPNFIDPFATNDAEDLARILSGATNRDATYGHLHLNNDGKLSGSYAYQLPDGRLFKPTPGQDISNLTAGQYVHGQTMLKGRGVPKSAKIRLSTLQKAKPASTGEAITFNTLPGHVYEQALANHYITSGWTGKGSARIDFDNAQWHSSTPIGRGPNNFTRRWGQADAIKGLSHGPRLIMEKLWAQNKHHKPFHKEIMKAASTGVLDLTMSPFTDDFAEISGTAPSDKKAKSSNIFHPTQSKTFPGLKPGSGRSLSGKGAERLKPFKIHWNLDAFHMNHNGLIPNFSDPLGEAIAREKSALKSQGSSAQVYISQDNRLKDPKNPMGLLVANRRDEPISGSQGVNRALSRGLNPKHHGASNGFFPNFMTKAQKRAQNDPAFAANVGNISKSAQIKTDGIDELNDSAKGASTSVSEHGDASEKGTLMGMDLMGAMFALTSVSYAVEGALGDVESTGGKLMKTFNSIVMGGGQAAMVFQGMNSVADGFAKKNTKTGNLLSKVAKGAGIFGAAIGAAIPIFDSLKNFEMFQTPFEKLQKTIKETSQAFEHAKAAVEGLAKIEEEREALGKMEASTKPKTLKTELEMFNRRTQLIQTENEYNKTLAELQVSVGLTDEQMKKLSSSSADAQVEIAKIMRGKAVKEGALKTVGDLSESMSEASVNLYSGKFFSSIGTGFLNATVRDNDVQSTFQEDTQAYFTKRQQAALELGLQSGTVTSGLKEGDLNKLINIFQQGINQQALNPEKFQQDESSAVRHFRLSEAGGKALSEELKKMIISPQSASGNARGSTFDDKTIQSSMIGFVESLGGIADPQAMRMALDAIVKGLVESKNRLNDNSNEQERVDKEFLNKLKEAREEMISDLKLSSKKTAMSLERLGTSISIESDQLAFANELKVATGLLSKEMQHRIETEAEIVKTNKEFALSVKKKQKELDDRANDIIIDMGVKNDMLDQKFTSTSSGALTSGKARNPMQENRVLLLQTVRSMTDELRSVGARFTDHSTGRELRPDATHLVKKGIEGKLQPEKDDAAFFRFQKKITRGGPTGREGAVNPQEVKDAFNEYLLSIKGASMKAKAIQLAKEKGLISADTATNAIRALAKEEEAILADTKEQRKLLNATNGLKKQQNAQNVGTLGFAQQMYEKTREAAQNEDAVLAAQKERRRIDVVNSGTALERNRAISKTLENEYVLSDIQQNANIAAESKLITDHEAEVIKGAQLRAEALILEHLELSEKLMSLRVKNEAQQLRNSVTKNKKLLDREKEEGIFDVRSQTTNENSTIDQDRAAEQFASDLRNGSFQLQALHSMADASRNFTKELIIAQTKLAKGEFGREGVREIQMNRINMAGGVQKAKAQRDVYAAAGNAPRAAEVNTQVQTQMRDLNKELNRGNLFLDTWRVKLAEANERIANFSQTLAETSFDAVRDGFRQMFTDITEGTKSTGDIALNFFGSIAKKIQDKLFDQAADQITAGMFEVFGLKQYHTGGIVSKYAAGGKTNDVPAMLTAGEYVVRKKIVDKIGLNELNKINQTGSLDDLYNKPNDPDDFELFNSGGMVHPPIIRLKEGGSLNNYLSPKSEAQGFNEGGQISSAIGALSETIERFTGGLVFLNQGGFPKARGSRKWSGVESDKDRGYKNLGAGLGMMAGTTLGKMAFGKDKNEPYGGPTAPTRPQQLNTSSALNIDPTGRQMSARFRREDSYSKDYGKYLLDKYDYDVQQRNQKQMERAQQIGAIATTATMMAGMAIGKKITEGPAPTADDLEAKVKRDSPGFQRITRGDHNLNQYQREAQGKTALMRSQPQYVTHSQAASQQFAQSKSFSDFSSSYSYDNLVKNYYNKGGSVFSPYSYFNKGGSVVSPYSYFYKGGRVNEGNYATANNVSYMSQGGMVHGPGGIDKVGPVMLDRGEYVIKASSVNKVEKQYPGFFDKLNSIKMNEGGSVGEAAAATTNNTENITNEGSSSNVTVNINVSSGGEATVQGGDQAQQDFGYKIKEAVVGVIAEQKRVGGMLRGY